jgi:membrane fusion protein, multidrug efflux system
VRKATWIVVGVLMLGGAGAFAYKQRALRKSPDTAQSGSAARAVGPGAIEFAASDIMTLQPGEISRSIPITGSLRPTNQTLVRSKVAGEIIELNVKEGSAVRAGQMIARIDPIEFEWRVKEREANLRSADAQLDQARRTLENNKQLLEKNFISQNAFDNAKFSLDAAQGNRDAALAQLTMARKSLSDTVVGAPMTGIVAERFAQVGEKVSPDNKLVSIIDLSRMEIEAPVPASDASALAVGQEVELAIEGIETRQIGRIIRINPGTQAGTRSIPIYIGLDNKDPRVRAGLFAQGNLAVATRRNIISVPSVALRDAGGRTFVYGIDGDTLVERDVQTGLRDDSAPSPNGGIGIVEITSGLKSGDRIVAVNLGPLRAGSSVKVASIASGK